ncbi:MAG: hypothetical protein GMKNLPBB_02835 [Myxococcota bacterium]|nr:hypothetical protein [Myxococcota bacterium]
MKPAVTVALAAIAMVIAGIAVWSLGKSPGSGGPVSGAAADWAPSPAPAGKVPGADFSPVGQPGQPAGGGPGGSAAHRNDLVITDRTLPPDRGLAGVRGGGTGGDGASQAAGLLPSMAEAPAQGEGTAKAPPPILPSSLENQGVETGTGGAGLSFGGQAGGAGSGGDTSGLAGAGVLTESRKVLAAAVKLNLACNLEIQMALKRGGQQNLTGLQNQLVDNMSGMQSLRKELDNGNTAREVLDLLQNVARQNLTLGDAAEQALLAHWGAGTRHAERVSASIGGPRNELKRLLGGLPPR